MGKVLSSKSIVSIILPVFNRAALLERCIGSVLKQTYKEWELISIDDGSTDDTLNILRQFENQFENIKVLTQENLKLPRTRNRGITESAGKFITFIDSDDQYSKDHIKLRVQFMQKHPEYDLIHGGIQIIGNEYVRDKDNPSEFIHISKCSVGATFFGKRKVFTRLNGFKDIPYSEDSEFIERARKIYNIGKVKFKTYLYYRNGKDSITNSYNP